MVVKYCMYGSPVGTVSQQCVFFGNPDNFHVQINQPARNQNDHLHYHARALIWLITFIINEGFGHAQLTIFRHGRSVEAPSSASEREDIAHDKIRMKSCHFNFFSHYLIKLCVLLARKSLYPRRAVPRVRDVTLQPQKIPRHLCHFNMRDIALIVWIKCLSRKLLLRISNTVKSHPFWISK